LVVPDRVDRDVGGGRELLNAVSHDHQLYESALECSTGGGAPFLGPQAA
jgi:hypothetical protein